MGVEPMFTGYQTFSRLRWIWAAVALALMCGPVPVGGQHVELQEKLKDLNIRLETPHYSLAGTVSDARLQDYAQALEYIHSEYEQGFAKLLGKKVGASKSPTGKGGKSAKSKAPQPTKPLPDEERSLSSVDPKKTFRVIAFAKDEEYAAFTKAFLSTGEFTIGMFVPTADLLLILDQGSPADTYEVLFHEAFHQFMHRYIQNPPTWLNEGLATHYGFARPTPQGLTFAKPKSNFWKLTRELLDEKEVLPLWKVVSADGAKFHDLRPLEIDGFEDTHRQSIYYAQAYTLVHMLIHDRDGLIRLQDYIKELADNKDGKSSKITEKYFGPDVCERMTPFWIRHVESRPEVR